MKKRMDLGRTKEEPKKLEISSKTFSQPALRYQQNLIIILVRDILKKLNLLLHIGKRNERCV
jgi:hypothetical protein